jgi:hypothetical protein
MASRRFTTLTCLGGLCCLAPAAHARINFDFDYSLDGPTGFFAQNPAARTALQQASTVYSDRLLDPLAAITPSGTNTWTAKFNNPATGQAVTLDNLTIPANTLKVYIGARSLGGPLANGGPGGLGASGTSDFILAAAYRGQTGNTANPPTDFARWGGTIEFDNTLNWNFDLVGPHAGQQDFLSVATHELGHVLGFGTGDTWKKNYAIPGAGVFSGPKAQALYGGPVPLDVNGAHFNNGTQSTAGGVPQETLMDPDITTGTRKYITLLDFAALDDLGWDLARPGDANADGTVNFNDLLLLAQNYNSQTRRWALGDFDANGVVNFNDLLLLARNYNSSGPQPADLPPGTAPDIAAPWAAPPAQAAVPEPTSMATLLFATIPLLATRRRRRT